MAKVVKERALVLVKAYPQPSQKYEETVCCAGITAQGEFVRIYPVRYRRLPPAKRFERWDIIEFESIRPLTIIGQKVDMSTKTALRSSNDET